jgi:hypothetical protein
VTLRPQRRYDVNDIYLLSLLKMHKNTPPLLHPSEGILASRKWECAVLITTKNDKKVENLSAAPRRRHAGGRPLDGAPDPAAFLNRGRYDLAIHRRPAEMTKCDGTGGSGLLADDRQVKRRQVKR